MGFFGGGFGRGGGIIGLRTFLFQGVMSGHLLFCQFVSDFSPFCTENFR